MKQKLIDIAEAAQALQKECIAEWGEMPGYGDRLNGISKFIEILNAYINGKI